jgi:hypothetical protein
MKAGKYITWHAPYERTSQIDDLFLFFKIRKVRLTKELYSLMLRHARPYLHEYIREKVTHFTGNKFIPAPINQSKRNDLPKPTKRRPSTRISEPAKGLSADDPIRKVSNLNRQSSIIINQHPKDDEFEYGLSDW